MMRAHFRTMDDWPLTCAYENRAETLHQVIAEIRAAPSANACERLRTMVPIPTPGRFGDNVTQQSGNTPWYRGPTLLEHLEAVEVEEERTAKGFLFPVQWVNRPNLAASGVRCRVTQMTGSHGAQERTAADDAVTLCLVDELDIERGNVLASQAERPVVADQFAPYVLWRDDEPLLPARQYMERTSNLWTTGSVTHIKHRMDVNTLETRAAETPAMNEIGVCNLATGIRVPMDPCAENRLTDGFIRVDRYTSCTAGYGISDFGLRRATNIHQEQFLVDKAARAAALRQKPTVLRLAGLSSSGKSASAKIVEQKLHDARRHVYSLDGDNLRHRLDKDLGFTDSDRVENIRRGDEVAKLFVDVGLIALCSFISPFRAERQMVLELLAEGEFVEIFVDTPLEERVWRDAKGLHVRDARRDRELHRHLQPPRDVRGAGAAAGRRRRHARGTGRARAGASGAAAGAWAVTNYDDDIATPKE